MFLSNLLTNCNFGVQLTLYVEYRTAQINKKETKCLLKLEFLIIRHAGHKNRQGEILCWRVSCATSQVVVVEKHFPLELSTIQTDYANKDLHILQWKRVLKYYYAVSMKVFVNYVQIRNNESESI